MPSSLSENLIEVQPTILVNDTNNTISLVIDNEFESVDDNYDESNHEDNSFQHIIPEKQVSFIKIDTTESINVENILPPSDK